MSFNLPVVRSDGSIDIHLQYGAVLFVLGANGSGKSSLLQRWYSSNLPLMRRISAHRQTWFKSNAVSMSPFDKKTAESQVRNSDKHSSSRWKDDYPEKRTSISIFELIDAENVRARRIAGAVDAGNISLAQTMSSVAAPIKHINELLRLSNLPIEISVIESEQVLARKAGSKLYSISELSDGERNALLIASDVLTARPGTLILIDEPERHLHRSIISPLLTSLFSKRSDCAFVVSTHDLMLPVDNPEARTLLVRGCRYGEKNEVVEWDADILSDEMRVEDGLKAEIIGSRRKILFVEGTESGLDKPLYSLLFPGFSVISKNSCRDVEHSVVAVRSSSELHWLAAYGIVDHDRRSEKDIAELRKAGVYALPIYSVESVYYHTEIRRVVAVRQCGVSGGDVTTVLEQAKSAALSAISRHVQRLSERAVEARVRKELLGKLPQWKDFSEASDITVAIDVKTIVNDEVARLRALLDSEDLESILSTYPVRETPALGEIATKLGFRNRARYEQAVIKAILDDVQTLNIARGLFGFLVGDADPRQGEST